MKKSLFILLLTIVCIGCTRRYPGDYAIDKSENIMYGWTYLDNCVKYRTITINDHEYLMFISDLHKIPAVVHSESCPCKNKKK